MRIAFIAIKGMPIGGGIEKFTEELGTRLVRKGHKVRVYCSRDYGTKGGCFNGMDVRTVWSLNTRSLHKLSTCASAVYDVLRGNDTDIAHIHAVGPSIFSLLTRAKRIPTVVQTHGLEWKRDKWGAIGKAFFRLADFSAVYFPDKTTSVSKLQKRYYERKFNREVIYIPPGISETKTREPKWILEKGITPRKYVLFAARLVAEKGAHWLIEGFRKIKTDYKLVIAGDASHEEKYKNHLKKIAAGDERIIFTGFLTGEPLEELFSNAYLFCLPSTLEGLPIALLEAMSFGNYCLASDIEENREALESHGFMFKNRSVEDLRRVLTDLIMHPEAVEKKREEAKVHVMMNYSWDRVADEMEELYRDLMKQKVRSGAESR
jgi:glycosyltransferase involved in cell wall biosynthesis